MAVWYLYFLRRKVLEGASVTAVQGVQGNSVPYKTLSPVNFQELPGNARKRGREGMALKDHT